VVKRAVDVVGAAVGLLLASPVLLAAAAAIRLDSRGRVLFRQDRLGLDGRSFQMLKFRTMRTDADDAIHREYVTRMLVDDAVEGGKAGVFKLADDPRITRTGRWLRKTSLDELPQLINVLKGQMSLVGPRPVLAWEAELFTEEERLRFAVKPGLTGLWQVAGRNQMSMRDALRFDVEYVRHQSLTLDAKIAIRTVPALLKGF
jgi:lipopolysaccharide/colanic/teichoic acid biosynthesis glycosyltransferase